MGTGVLNAGGGVEILLIASCYRNRDRFRPDRPLGSYTDVTFTKLFLLSCNVEHVSSKFSNCCKQIYWVYYYALKVLYSMIKKVG